MRSGILSLLCFSQTASGGFLKDTCIDTDLHDVCLTDCRLQYLNCLSSCDDSSSCQSYCRLDFASCDASCPCGADCSLGCESCEHPLCGQCYNAEISNDDYKLCVVNALDKQNDCIKQCPPILNCMDQCYSDFRVDVQSCPCFESESSTTPQSTTTTTKRETSTTTSFETTTVSIVDQVGECEYINELLEVDICVLDARYPLNHCNKNDKGCVLIEGKCVHSMYMDWSLCQNYFGWENCDKDETEQPELIVDWCGQNFPN